MKHILSIVLSVFSVAFYLASFLLRHRRHDAVGSRICHWAGNGTFLGSMVLSLLPEGE